MTNSEVFGSPMILTGRHRHAVSPFGAATGTGTAMARAGRWLGRVLQHALQRQENQRRIRKTVVELSRLDNHVLRDIGLDRGAIIGAAHEAEKRRRGARDRPM
jgi:uncharacterized protein YjiS (DUF1127 family)